MAAQSRLRAAVSALGTGRQQDRRQQQRRQRRLANEIAAYRTPAERLELDAILGRHSADEIKDIEEILRYQDNQRALAARVPHHAGTRV